MNQSDSNLLISIRNEVSALSPILEKVGRFVADNPDYVMRHTISELATSIDTSEGSITRFCRAFGFKGFADFRTALALEQGALRLDSHAEDETQAVVASIRDSNSITNGKELAAAAAWLHQADAIALCAVGTAVPVALFLQTNLMRMGKAASFANHLFPASALLLQQGRKTAIIAIHTSDVSADMLQTLTLAKQQGARIISITRGSFTPFSKLSDWNLQAAVALNGEGEYGFAEIAGALMVADRLLQQLEGEDERYGQCRKAHQRSVFSIDSVANKLAQYFMS